MANFAQLTVGHNDVPEVNEQLTIRIIVDSVQIANLTWYFVNTRAFAYQITRGANISEQAVNTLSAVASDLTNFNYTQYLSISPLPDGFEITGNDYNVEFSYPLLQTVVDINYTAPIAPTPEFTLTGYSLSQATDKCSNVKVTLTQENGSSPYEWISPVNASTSLIADLTRTGTTVPITIEDDNGDRSTVSVPIPPGFDSSYLLSITQVPNASNLDATVTVFMNSGFTYQYSLDGETFQESNIFSGVIEGEYTVYIADQYGCIITEPLTVDLSVFIRDPYTVIPKANPIRFILNGVYKYQTLENTLYKNEYYLGENKPCYHQKYNSGDGEIPVQFRTNYSDIEVKLYDIEENEVELALAMSVNFGLEQISNNLGIRSKYDCIVFNLGNNQVGVYFTEGNIYDPLTDDIIDVYELNGQVPEFGKVGNTITLSGEISGSYLIKKVEFNNSVQANVIVIDSSWISSETSLPAIVDCIYDRLNYEVFQFYLEPSSFLGVYYFVLTFEDENYTTLTYTSETFEINNNHIRTNLIEYSVSKNTGIDYTNFIGKVRVKSLDPYCALTPGGEVTAYKDSQFETTKLKDVPTMEGVMTIIEQPRYMIEKLRLIFGHINIWINGEKWTNEEQPNVQNFDKFALKNMTVTLRRNDYENYGGDFIDIDGEAVKTNDTIILQ